MSMTWNFHQSTRDPLPIADFKKINKDKINPKLKVIMIVKNHLKKLILGTGKNRRKHGKTSKCKEKYFTR